MQWTSKDSVRPRVRWGLQSGTYSNTSTGTTTTYGRDDLCGEPATTVGWHAPGNLHAAVLSDLLPGHRYFYSFGDEVRGLPSCSHAAFLASRYRGAVDWAFPNSRKTTGIQREEE